MWTNPDFVDGPAGSDTLRLFYGAYQQWSADSNPKDGNNTGVGMVSMTVDRFAYFTNLKQGYPGTHLLDDLGLFEPYTTMNVARAPSSACYFVRA